MRNEPAVHPDSVSCLETRNNITLIVLAIISNNCENARGALIIFWRAPSSQSVKFARYRDRETMAKILAISRRLEPYLGRKASCSCCDEIGPVRLENVADETLPVRSSTLYRCERYNSRKSQSCPARRIIFFTKCN